MTSFPRSWLAVKLSLLACLFVLGGWGCKSWSREKPAKIVNAGPLHVLCISSDYVNREKDLIKGIATLQSCGKEIIDIKPTVAAKTGFTEYNFLIIYRERTLATPR
jgi:hypothetical protein